MGLTYSQLLLRIVCVENNLIWKYTFSDMAIVKLLWRFGLSSRLALMLRDSNWCNAFWCSKGKVCIANVHFSAHCASWGVKVRPSSPMWDNSVKTLFSAEPRHGSSYLNTCHYQCVGVSASWHTPHNLWVIDTVKLWDNESMISLSNLSLSLASTSNLGSETHRMLKLESNIRR